MYTAYLYGYTNKVLHGVSGTGGGVYGQPLWGAQDEREATAAALGAVDASGRVGLRTKEEVETEVARLVGAVAVGG